MKMVLVVIFFSKKQICIHSINVYAIKCEYSFQIGETGEKVRISVFVDIDINYYSYPLSRKRLSTSKTDSLMIPSK